MSSAGIGAHPKRHVSLAAGHLILDCWEPALLLRSEFPSLIVGACDYLFSRYTAPFLQRRSVGPFPPRDGRPRYACVRKANVHIGPSIHPSIHQLVGWRPCPCLHGTFCLATHCSRFRTHDSHVCCSSELRRPGPPRSRVALHIHWRAQVAGAAAACPAACPAGCPAACPAACRAAWMPVLTMWSAGFRGSLRRHVLLDAYLFCGADL